VPYDQVRHRGNADATVRQSVWTAMYAMLRHQITPTGRFYSEVIRGK